MDMPETASTSSPQRRALVVEDDPAIALIVETILGAAGFAIDLRETGDAALEAAPADLLVADLTLPGAVGGVALSHRLRDRKPDLAVIYMSGAIDDDSGPDGAVAGAALIGKPFRRARLLAAVEEAFASRPAA
jgi:DNA-binding response OmpR family regulator